MSRTIVTVGTMLSLAALATTAVFTVGAATSSESRAPASINHQTLETALLSVTLTPEAERRLGIVTSPVRRQKLSRTRLYGGEVVAPPRSKGGEIGTVYPGGVSGSLYQLADARIAAAGRVELLAAQLKGAQIALARAERMLTDESGSGRAVDDARIALGVAEADYRAAVARRDLLGKSQEDAPTRVWIRVPVFAGDLSTMQTNSEVKVATFEDSDVSGFFPAKRVQAPRSADPTSGTVDHFYEIGAANGRLLPGQRVKVIVPLDATAEQLVVPWSAVIHDVNGGTWVYERTGERVYSRRPVQLRSVVGELAALKSGPAEGASIVTTGAAELFGTEFGVPH